MKNNPSISIYNCSYNDTATTEIYTLSLHDALPISHHGRPPVARRFAPGGRGERRREDRVRDPDAGHDHARSEEHTSELQSPYDLVCRLLLEKKKKKRNIQI